ncbi:MAG: MogA/MoaB family molybdenum cofactor biosynthesis protein [Propionibacteriaceae bacterium]
MVITGSTRASAGVYEDKSGPVIASALAALEFEVDGPLIVPDGDEVGQALRDGVQQGYAVIITTGGTGLNPHDHTPEQTRAVLDYDVPQLAAAVASYGVEHGVPTAVLSRGLSGVSGSSLIVNLPGSSGGARDGMAVLGPVLAHAVSQIRGGDH